MRLIKAHVTGIARIVDSTVNLEPKVVAVVGPNEAGKTTLLNALAHVTQNMGFPSSRLSRGASTSSEDIVSKLTFALDENDEEVLTSLDLQMIPSKVSFSRSADGQQLFTDFSPQAIKSVEKIEASVSVLDKLARAGLAGIRFTEDSVYAPEDTEGFHEDVTSITGRLNDIVRASKAITNDPSLYEDIEIDFESISASVTGLLQSVDATDDSEELRMALSDIKRWFEIEDPFFAASNIAWSRAPKVLLFNDEDRSLQSAYPLSDEFVINPPAALRNLLDMASVNLSELWEVREDISRRDSKLSQANKRLKKIFRSAWNQKPLQVVLTLDGHILRVTIKEANGDVTEFGERSAGLQMFVALVAFLKANETNQLPILLIDEAENHLHIDAQADLVSMFVNQTQAAKIIYTTHSPACLPPDLGTGIRSIVPNSENSQISDIKNSFWQGDAGFSPLLLAMGASAAAFTPARYVVLAEGATEMILLPALLRSALDVSEIPYQIAPGLSEVPKDLYPSLDLEAAKVVYLVDSDPGGNALRKHLISSGIPEDHIISTGVPGSENLLIPETFRNVVEEIVAESNPELIIEELSPFPELGDQSWGTAIKHWADDQGIQCPSKVAIATKLVNNVELAPSDSGKAKLIDFHTKIEKALGITG